MISGIGAGQPHQVRFAGEKPDKSEHEKTSSVRKLIAAGALAMSTLATPAFPGNDTDWTDPQKWEKPDALELTKNAPVTDSIQASCDKLADPQRAAKPSILFDPGNQTDLGTTRYLICMDKPVMNQDPTNSVRTAADDSWKSFQSVLGCIMGLVCGASFIGTLIPARKEDHPPSETT